MYKGNNWFQNAIIYQILIDRFAGFNQDKVWIKSHFIGGNIKGIINNLSYLKNLGINTLWISPFYETSAYHGYHITNFFKVDPHFGDKKDLKCLINLVHQNNMYIIADFVPNHVSRYHPFFIKAVKNKESKYYNWFYFTNWPNEYLCFLTVKDLPKLNLENNEVAKYIISAAKYWLSFGLDGYRLDHVIGPSNYFWKRFSREIKKDYPKTVLIGEAWMQGISWKELKTIQIPWKRMKWLQNASSDSILRNYVSLLDGVLDFNAQQLIQQYICQKKGTIKDFKKKIKRHYSKFPSNYFLPIFLDNHDMDRVLFQCNNDIKLLKKAADIQFSLSQPKIIYYGTEQKMTQKKSVWSEERYGDLYARKPMPWNNNLTNNELYNFYRNLILKKNNY